MKHQCECKCVLENVSAGTSAHLRQPAYVQVIAHKPGRMTWATAHREWDWRLLVELRKIFSLPSIRGTKRRSRRSRYGNQWSSRRFPSNSISQPQVWRGEMPSILYQSWIRAWRMKLRDSAIPQPSNMSHTQLQSSTCTIYMYDTCWKANLSAIFDLSSLFSSQFPGP